MTLPASGSISMAQVLAELQIATPARAYPISLADTDVRTLAGVPTGSISMSNLYGKSSAYVVNPIPAIVVEDSELSPTNPSASVTFDTNGTVSVTGNGSSTAGNWYSPTTTSIGSSYWVRLTVNSGTAPNAGSGAGTWLALTAARSWTWTRTTTGVTTANVTIQIATDSGGTNIVATEASVSVISERTV